MAGLGKTVRVWTRSEGLRDSMGEPCFVWEHEDVGNVLVRPLAGGEGSPTDTARNLRPDGVSVRFRLAFPKTYKGNLRHARVSLIEAPWNMDFAPTIDREPPDDALLVVGDPQREDPCPTQWNLLADVGRRDG